MRNVRHVLGKYARIFMFTGPVGLGYALKLAWIDRRMKHNRVCIEREQLMHRANLAALNHELNELVSAQQGTHIAAAQHWSWCHKQAGQSKAELS